jgi:hypothetical protein
MKRLGRGHYGVAIAAIYVSSDPIHGRIVFSGAMPSCEASSSRSRSRQ